jgi:arabinofuranosyltransferase
VLWELFSLLYYGFPIPNTAYAKLNTGVGAGELAARGFLYFTNSLGTDPLTLLVVLTGIAAPFVCRKRLYMPIAIGMVLYLIYVVRIGGDFMSGRFLTAPFFCAAVLFPLYGFLVGKKSIPVFVVSLGIGLFSPYPPLFSGSNYGMDRGKGLETRGKRSDEEGRGPFWKDVSGFIGKYGHSDERAFYYQFAGLLNSSESGKAPDMWWVNKGRSLRKREVGFFVWQMIGYTGYFAGPHVFLLDFLAIGDPLLSKLPARAEPNWRSGHFDRIIPAGYMKTCAENGNHLKDPNLAKYYDKLTVITRGDLFDSDRLAEIWKMNTGQYDHLIDFLAYRYPYDQEANLSDLEHPKPDGTVWNQEGNIVFRKGARINSENKVHATFVEISLDSDDVYLVAVITEEGDYFDQLIPIETQLSPGFPLERPKKTSESLITYRFEVPEWLAESGYNQLRVLPLSGGRKNSLGHVRLLEANIPGDR